LRGCRCVSRKDADIHTRYRSKIWIRELLGGAVQPSLPAVVGALLIATVLFVCCLTLLTPDLLGAADCGYFMVNWRDDYAYLTSAVLHITRGDSSKQMIAVIGASASRESIATGDYFAGLMEEKLGQPFNVHQLTAGGLTHWEAAAVADCIAEHVRGVVVLEVSPGKMALPIRMFEGLVRQPRLALDSKAFDDEARLAGIKLPRRTGNFFLDHHGFFSARPAAVLNLLRGPVVPDFHQAETWRPISEEEWLKAEEALRQRIEGYAENSQRNFQVVERTIAQLREAGGIHVVLLEAVQNPRADQIMRDSPESRKSLEAYERDIRAFVKAWNVPYLNINAEAQLVPSEFIDTSHLRDAKAAERYTRVLASHLASLISSEQTDQEG